MISMILRRCRAEVKRLENHTRRSVHAKEHTNNLKLDSNQSLSPKISMDMFDVLRTLGAGSYAQVFLVMHKGSKKKYALKTMQKLRIIATQQVAHVLSEKNILEKLSHPNIVKLHCTFNDSENIYLLLEHVSGGDMFSVLQDKGRFHDGLAKFYFGSVVLALEHLHTQQIIYRDLKPENLLLDGKGYVKLTDFGLSKSYPSETFTTCGTPEFMAPEIVKGEKYGPGVDWWSAGVLLYEFLVGNGPFTGSDRQTTFSNILDRDIKFPCHVAAYPRSLILALTDRNPKTRLGASGAEQIKSHPWFNDLDWDALAACTLPAPTSQ